MWEDVDFHYLRNVESLLISATVAGQQNCLICLACSWMFLMKIHSYYVIFWKPGLGPSVNGGCSFNTGGRGKSWRNFTSRVCNVKIYYLVGLMTSGRVFRVGLLLKISKNRTIATLQLDMSDLSQHQEVTHFSHKNVLLEQTVGGKRGKKQNVNHLISAFLFSYLLFSPVNCQA